MLEIEGIKKYFGGIKALDGVSMKIEENTINGLIGPNGSGKTTLFNVISGFYPPDSGKVILEGEDITGLPPHKIFHKGICRTFQVSDLRIRMTVLENILLAQRQRGEKLLDALFRSSFLKDEEANVNKSLIILKKLRIEDFGNEVAGVLSGGQRKLLNFGMIWAAKPKLFLLDEPTAGVNLTLANKLLEVIRGLKEEGNTFIVIEHNMKIINRVCDKVFVLCNGKKIAEGTPEEVQKNDEVLEAYLSGYRG